MMKINLSIKIYRRLATAAALLLLTSASTAATTMAPAVADSAVTTQFNALDHMLQRPAPARSFGPGSSFATNWFLTAEGGAQWLHKPASLINTPGAAPRVGLTAGSWFTPVHGLRFGVSTGWNKTAGDRRLYYGSFSVDYLMNLSALVAGENPERRFDVLATAGAEAYLQYGAGSRSYAGGARIGLQLRWNATPSTFLYLEPRFGINNDGIDRHYTWQRYDWNAMVMFGVGYRMAPLRLRRQPAAVFDPGNFRQNIFYGAGGGAMALGNHHTFSDHDRYLGAGATAFIGKMFSATSGLRGSVSAGVPGRLHGNGPRNKVIIADLDYVLNLNSAFNGYDPRRRLELNFLAGPTVAIPNGHGRKAYVGFGASLQGVWNLTDNWGLLIEPRMRLFEREFAWESRRRVNLLGSVMVGFRYTVGDYRSASGRINSDANRADWLRGNRCFIGAGAGVNSHGAFGNLGHFESAPAVSLMFGRWFAPASAWRLTLDYNYIGRRPRYMDLGVGADYMLSLSSLSAGWNDRRVFDISAFGGVEAGVAHYSGKNHGFFGLRAGLHGMFNLGGGVGLYLEPQIGVKRTPGIINRSFVPELRLLAGIAYRFGSDTRRGGSAMLPGEARNYVSGAAGPTLSSQTLLHSSLRKVGGQFDVALGRWISRSSALQIGMSCDIVPAKGHDNTNVATIHADYMLDLIQAMSANPERRFGIMPHVGGGFAFSNSDLSDGSIGWALRGGVRFNWRATPRVDIFVDPTMTLWQSKLVHIYSNRHQFSGTGSVLVGAAWRF